MRHPASSDSHHRQDDEKLAEVLKELLEVREQHGPEEKVQAYLFHLCRSLLTTT